MLYKFLFNIKNLTRCKCRIFNIYNDYYICISFLTTLRSTEKYGRFMNETQYCYSTRVVSTIKMFRLSLQIRWNVLKWDIFMKIPSTYLLRLPRSDANQAIKS